MKIALFTEPSRGPLLEQLIGSLDHLKPACICYQTYDDLIGELPRSGCELLIIARDGAGGMEGARAARILQPELPIIWFSDDKGFGPESYRVGCSFFSAAPITRDLLLRALDRSGHTAKHTDPVILNT